MKKLFYLLLMFALAGVWACDSSSGSSGGGVIPNSITIQGSNTVKLGKPSQYSAILNPANFTSEEVVWSSDNESVGTIDSTGLFKANAEGTTNITASAGGVTSAPFQVTVSIPVASVSISSTSPNPNEVNVGQSKNYVFEVAPQGAKYKNVTWNVDNTTIANIDKDTGVLIGHAPGTVNVTVTVDEITSKPYPVKVILPLESISINGPDSVNALAQATYTVTSTPEGATITNVEWSVNNTNIATIDASTGVLTAKNTAGQVTISVNVDGKTASKMINIEKVLYIYGNNTTSIGGIITLSAVNNTTSNLTWNSSNPSVATVENGVVKGVSAGSTDITVSENENTSAAFTVTIVEMPAEGYKIVDGVYHVYSVAGFKKWVEAVTANKSTSCYLYSDLDFANEASNAMINVSFGGTFDGNGHIIKNYAIPNGNAFIKTVSGSKSKFLNTIFDNVTVTSTDTDTGIVTTSNSSGTIENVHVRNSKIIVNGNQGYNQIGIIAADAFSSTIKNCSVTNSSITVNGKMHNSGGIAGNSRFGSKISGCFVNNLTISTQGSGYTTSGIGGIVGQQQGTTSGDTVIGCGVINAILKDTGNSYVGGLIGVGGSKLIASYFSGELSKGKAQAGLDFGNFNGKVSTLFAKQKGGSIGTVSDKNNTTIVDDTNVTWAQAVEKMNQALVDNGYTDFIFTYNASTGYPVIEYAK